MPYQYNFSYNYSEDEYHIILLYFELFYIIVNPK